MRRLNLQAWILSTLMGCVVLGGCASGPSQQQAHEVTTAVPLGKARIVVIRPAGVSEALVPFTRKITISIDGASLGLLNRSSYVMADVEPGSHNVKINVDQTLNHGTLNVPMSVNAGDVGYVLCRAQGGPTACQKLDQHKAQSEIAAINQANP